LNARKKYSKEFKLDAVSLVVDQKYSQSEAAKNLGIDSKLLGRWVRESQAADDGQAFRGNGKLSPEQDEIRRLKSQVKRLEMERDILKNCLHSIIAHLIRNTIIGKVRKVVERLLEMNNPVKKPDPGGSADPMLVAF
jgi:transposase